MKNLGWGNVLISLGIIGSVLGIGAAISLLTNSEGMGLIGLVIIVLLVVAGPRLIIKGIHQKAADVQARRTSPSRQLP